MRSLILRCPKTAVALHAAAEELPRGVTVRESLPGTNARGWTLRFANRGSSERVTGVLRCVRLRLPGGISGVSLAVSSSSQPVEVRAGASVRIPIACRPGYTATGHGISADDDAVSTAAVVPSRNGWTFRFENTSSRTATVTPRVRCLRRAVSGRRNGDRVRLAFDIGRSAWSHTVGGGSETYENACGRDLYSVATGVSLDPDADILLSSTFPGGERDGHWLFRNPNGSQPVKSYLLCLARDSRFQ